ncbi:hypothetical protein H735_09130 [Vibrio owensii CAIM 1854 = LMG 25443]|uniref:Uncharacterized protein n=1 Tax=Vibrio owensii CAIM 1854 = LMG 25443 TaxID=1229493 RepID=A0A0C1W9T0_9VIBR|nr:hypothetical protein H735_09130 [Vibrio owensii CAIM 1854 = LMG 25443]
MIIWIGSALLLLGVLSGIAAFKHFDSAFKPSTEKRSSPIVYQYYAKTCFRLLIVGGILLTINYIDFESWSQETRSKVTLYAVVITAIASMYTMAQTFLNSRRQRDIERRIKNHNDDF